MIISRQTSSIWQRVPEDIQDRIEAVLAAGPPGQLFFRADDIAIPSHNQDRILDLFSSHQVPLSCALVPAWLNQVRWQKICEAVHQRHGLFAWHQHGWNHRNHQLSGKKQEFGPEREKEQKRGAIVRGRDKLHNLLGSHFLPVFTPPWNRIDKETMQLLKEEGFWGISRCQGDKLPAIAGLPDIPVNVDLHTRRETSAEAGWAALLDELRIGLASGRAGLMLHHQRMNASAFHFLDQLLLRLKNNARIRLVHFGTILRPE